MDIIVPKSDLVAVLTRTRALVDRKSTMAVLTCVHLVAEKGRLLVSSTNLQMSLRASIDVETKKVGEVAIPCGDLLDRVRMMPEGPIQITGKDDHGVTLKAVGMARRFTLPGFPPSDYPQLPTSPESGGFTLDAKMLGGMIARVDHAISTDESRAHLSSMLVEIEAGLVRLVATDGHRLAKIETAVDGVAAAAPLLIPIRAVRELRRMCDESEGPIDIRADSANRGATVFVRAGSYSLGMRTVDATFPPYAQVIPKARPDSKATLPRQGLIDAVRAVSLASSEKTGAIELGFSTKALRVMAESLSAGDGFDELPMEFTGKALDIGCAARFLLDALECIGGEDVSIDLGAPLEPIGLRAPGYVAIVMPMQIV